MHQNIFHFDKSDLGWSWETFQDVVEPLIPRVIPKVQDIIVPVVSTERPVLIPHLSTRRVLYDTGPSESALARHEMNEYLRNYFFKKVLVKKHSHLLKHLTVENGRAIPREDEELGDISKKKEYIKKNILTYNKNMKILNTILKKRAYLNFCDLPDNLDLVSETQSRYVEKKLVNAAKKFAEKQ